MSINKLIVLGNVGQDPKVTTFQDGGKVAQFSLAATDKGYTTKSGATVPDHTEWFNIVAKGSTANVVEQYVHKGDKIYIEGKVKTRQYTAQDGQPRNITEVIVERLELCGGKQGGNFAPIDQPTAAAPAASQTAADTTAPADDLPF